jgi:hypothetical protein
MKINNSYEAPFGHKLYFKIFLALSILYILFQIKPGTTLSGNIYAGDDQSYYGHTASLVNDLDFDFSNNDVVSAFGVSAVTGKIVLAQPIGTSLLLVPFYATAKPFVLLLGFLTHSPFNQKHPIFFVFMSLGVLFYAYIGGYLLLKSLCLLGFDGKVSVAAVTAVMWGSMLPVYIFRRPIFSHVPEFFVLTVIIYLMIKYRIDKLLGLRQLIIFGIMAGIILITRWYAINIFFLILCYIFARKIAPSGFKQGPYFLLLFVFSAFIVFFFTQGLAWKTYTGGYFTLPYNPDKIEGTRPIMDFLSFQSLKNIFNIFAGQDWGILYTMLPVVIGMAGFFILHPLSISRNIALDRAIYLVVLSFPFFIVVKLGLPGCYYGFRHLLALVPFSCFGLAAFFERILSRKKRHIKLIWFFVVIVLIFNFFLILPFERSESTSLTYGPSVMGGTGWVNNAYIPNALKIYFTLPLKNLLGLFSRNLLGQYVLGSIYLFSRDIFMKIAGMGNGIQYFALDSPDKIIVLFYLPLAVAMLACVHRFLIRQIKSGEE